MAGHGFRRADWDFLGAFTENALQRAGLDHVADGRGCAMSVHVADVVGSELRVFERRHHHAISAIAVLFRLGHVIGIARHTVAHDFRENRCIAFLGVFEGFENQNARTFADHKTVAARVPGTAGVLRIVIPRGERLHGRKPADAHGRDGRLRASANHHLRGPALDNFEGVAHGMRGSGASRSSGGIRPFRTIANGNLPRSQIDDRRRNEKRRNLVRAAVQQLAMFALNDVESADAGRNVDANLIQIRILRFPVGGLHRKIRAGQRDLNETRHLLEFFFLDPLKGVEVLHFAGNLAVEAGGVEMRDRRDATASGDEVPPAFLRADTQRADQSNTRNNYPATQGFHAPI